MKLLAVYGFGIAAAILAGFLRFALEGLLPAGLPFLTFFLAIMLSGWYGGFGPSLMTTLLSALFTDYFLIEPMRSFAIGQPYRLALALYVLEGVLIGFLSSRAKWALDALRESEGRFSRFMQHLPGLAWVKDEAGRYVYVNPSAEAAFGMPKEHIYLKTDEDVFPMATALEFKTNDATVRNSGVALQTIEKMQQHDGYHESLVHKFPIPTDAGHSPMVAGIAIDITAYRRTESALAHSELRFRIMADSAPVLIWMADVTQACTWVNKPWLDFTGRSMNEELGAGWAEGIHPDDQTTCLGIYREAFDARQPFTLEYRLRRHDGVFRWILDNGVPCFFGDGTFTGYIGSCLDITDRKELELFLGQKTERLEAFSAKLEHLINERTADLRQSQIRLRALATELNLAEQRERKRLAAELHDGLAQMLVVARLRLSEVQKLSGVQTDCSERITQVQQELEGCLSYTKTLISNLYPPVLHEFGLASALRWLAEQMKRRNLLVMLDLCEITDLNIPEHQSVLLYQSVRELLINVTKYAGVDTAWVRMYRSESTLFLEVRDAGVGFTAESPDGSATTSTWAAKFGLFSIRERMRALGGALAIQSQVGQGTVATISLPFSTMAMHASPDSVASATLGPRPPTPQGLSKLVVDKIRVMLVDDHAVILQGLRSVLETYPDIEVVGEASDGQIAITKAEQLQPTAIVMDINMPNMNGIDATAHITKRFPQIVVIGLSVNANQRNEELMKEAGAAVLIPKEAAVDKLYQAIEHSVRRSAFDDTTRHVKLDLP
ncbi:hypothetical protein W02_31480 [Nitrospira sp. KM1]|uniref:PAS domain S-box protein n=1 Tax=Nitrospira sp. KM1 TaxID=1936990 RepID=UPI0013A782C9|nr:PAS domain S-box protein [Nitrospira sp. KM1]BCA56008.1 hypothetical protein W02_31480 [Nitrospira sp. KM1]